jgi:hypothetical protein
MIFIDSPPNYNSGGKIADLQTGVSNASDANAYFLDTGVNVLSLPGMANGTHLSILGQQTYAQLTGDLMDAIINP